MYITWSRYLGMSSDSSSAVEHATSDGLITAQFPFVKQSNKEALVQVYSQNTLCNKNTPQNFCHHKFLLVLLHDQPEIIQF